MLWLKNGCGSSYLKRQKELEEHWCSTRASGRVFAHSHAATKHVRQVIETTGSFKATTLDNGGLVFDVEVFQSSAAVRLNESCTMDLAKGRMKRDETKHRFSCLEIWLGEGVDDDRDTGTELGCAVLLVTHAKELVLVSTDMRRLGRLRPLERVEEFVATVGNNRVVYGYIRTNLRYIFPTPINCVYGSSKELLLDMDRREHMLDLHCVDRVSVARLQTLRGERVLVRGYRSIFIDQRLRFAEELDGVQQEVSQ